MLTGYENLKLHSLLYAVPGDIREKRIAEVLNLVGLTERKDDQAKKYSGGMRRRLEIARGLLHKRKVIFLDEPTLGKDNHDIDNSLYGRSRSAVCVKEFVLLIEVKLLLFILH